MTLAVLAVVLLLGAALLFLRRGSATARPKPGTALQVFQSRPAWRFLPPALLSALAETLRSAANAEAFALLCERTGILKNNILKNNISSQDPQMALGMIAMTLTSYANQAIGNKQVVEARRAAELAILLKPRYVIAWAIMALATYNSGDCKSASVWADRVLSFKPDPSSRDIWERAFADRDPEQLEAVEEQRALMREVKRACGE